MIQPGQPKSGRDRLPHSRQLQLYIYIPYSLEQCVGSLIGTLSKNVFDRCTSTGSEAFSLFICLDANKLVLLSFFSLLRDDLPESFNQATPQ